MSRKRILIVDDDAVVRKRLQIQLRETGYEIMFAIDGAEAVAASRKKRPDLILLDITFPPDVAHGGGVAWDGFRIIEWLRRLDESKNIPIIVISASEPEKCRPRVLALGAVDFLQKPIEDEDLYAALDKALGDSAAPSDTPAS